MKKIKQRSLHLVNYLISLLLSMIGVSCAVKNAPPQEKERSSPMIAMYGVPYSTYKISGRVENTKGQAVKGIEINVIESNVSTRSNDKGNFQLEGRHRFRPDSIYLVVNDVDGSENGEYENDTIILTPSYQRDKSANSWSLGDAKIEEVEISLKNKK
ncbi:MAG: radical SAM-associated putative lipoprotein [Paludibacteraceae bacterium]|nr:radical SAM-associated putative lipoprotein [Paludibacteraceae bacterium]